MNANILAPEILAHTIGNQHAYTNGMKLVVEASTVQGAV